MVEQSWRRATLRVAITILSHATDLRAAVGFHHGPEALSVELQKLGFTVHVADVLCCQQQIGFYQTADALELTDEILEAAGIDQAKLGEVAAKLDEELEETQSMLIG